MSDRIKSTSQEAALRSINDVINRGESTAPRESIIDFSKGGLRERIAGGMKFLYRFLGFKAREEHKRKFIR